MRRTWREKNGEKAGFFCFFKKVGEREKGGQFQIRPTRQLSVKARPGRASSWRSTSPGSLATWSGGHSNRPERKSRAPRECGRHHGFPHLRRSRLQTRSYRASLPPRSVHQPPPHVGILPSARWANSHRPRHRPLGTRKWGFAAFPDLAAPCSDIRRTPRPLSQ